MDPSDLFDSRRKIGCRTGLFRFLERLPYGLRALASLGLWGKDAQQASGNQRYEAHKTLGELLSAVGDDEQSNQPNEKSGSQREENNRIQRRDAFSLPR